MAEPKIVESCRVRLLQDVHTRGGRIFRKGVIMRVSYTTGEIHLSVSVRFRWHHLTLKKKEAKYLLEVVSPPKER